MASRVILKKCGWRSTTSVQPSGPVGSDDNSVSTCLCSRVKSDSCSLEN